MSLIPFILDLADELHEFSRCLANGADINDFGFGLYTGSDQQQPQYQQQQQQPSPRRSRTSSFSSFWMPSKRHHPYNRIKTACCSKSSDEAVVTPEKSDAPSSIVGGTPGKSASYSVVNKNGFQVSMNVKQFAPNELSVKTIDNCIVVEGRHDDKEDGHGVISRHFVRKYMLPKGYDPKDVLSTLSSDGILTVKAPPPPPPSKNDEPNERIVEIQSTLGSSPVSMASAKDTQAKEITKKVATPSARLECQLPEKRQKLDFSSEPESTEIQPLTPTLTPTPTPPPPPPPPPSPSQPSATETSIVTESASAEETNDVEMKKADEQSTEIAVRQQEQKQKPQQQQPNVGGNENNIGNKAETIGKVENQIPEKPEKNIAETKKILEETIAEPNGDTKTSCDTMDEKMDESCDVTTETTEKGRKTPAAVLAEVDASVDKTIATKMEVDDNDVDLKTKKTEIVAATIKASGTDKNTKAEDSAAAENNDLGDKTNNTDILVNNTTATVVSATNSNNNNNNSNNNNNKSTANTTISTSKKDNTENSTEDSEKGNGVVTGEIPVDISKSADSNAAINTVAANNAVAADVAVAVVVTKAIAIDTDTEAETDAKAESAVDGKVDTETAVLTTETSIIDDVALLKAAVTTTNPNEIASKEENIILSESIDSAPMDDVDCLLFKKTHLDNGSTTTAIVGTEEMAN